MNNFGPLSQVEFPTPLDLFSASIEKALLDWGLIGNSISTVNQHSTPFANYRELTAPGWNPPYAFQEVKLSDRTFSLQIHVTESISNALDAPSITRFFGTNASLVLHSVPNDNPVAWDVSDATILLLAISLAASSSSVTLPIFVPIGRASEFRLIGRRVGSAPVRFHTHLGHSNQPTTVNLSNVLEFFKSQFGHGLASARVSMKSEYLLESILKKKKQAHVSNHTVNGFINHVLDVDDPIVFFHITAFCDEFYAAESERKELSIEESDRIRLRIGYRSLNISLVAPTQCMLQLAMYDMDDIQLTRFSAAPISIVNSAKRKNLARNLNKVDFRKEWEGFLAEALYVVAFANNTEQIMDASYMVAALNTIFYPSSQDEEILDALGPNGFSCSLFEKLSRLSEKLVNVKAIQYIWMLFLDAIELHWNARVPFNLNDGNESEMPNLYESLLVQKLQMINCCILRESSRKKSKNMLGRKMKSKIKALSEDRELWEPYLQESSLFTKDIIEEQEILMLASGGGMLDGSKSLESDMAAFKAANPDAQMADFIRWFSPTDWVEEDNSKENQSDEFCENRDSTFIDESVDTDVSGIAQDLVEEMVEKSMIRKRGTLEKKGSLSPRMRKSGNDWEKLWLSAIPCPAHLQKPIFNAAANGSSALSDLRRIPLGTVILNFCCSLGCSTSRMLNENVKTHHLGRIVNNANNTLRHTKSALPLIHNNKAELKRDFDHLQGALRDLEAAENRVLVSKSLENKLKEDMCHFEEIIDVLSSGGEYVLENEVKKTFMKRIMPTVVRPIKLEEREFIVSSGTDRIYTQSSQTSYRICIRSSIDIN